MTKTALTFVIAVLGVGQTVGCSGAPDGTADPLLQAPDEQVQRAGGSTVQASSAVHALKHMASTPQDWILSREMCGVDNPPVPSIDQVMADVPASERAGALMNALMTEPVNGPGVVALLSLLVDTKDPGIAEKIATVYEKAPELAGRYVSNAEERLGTSLANTLDGTTQGIRMAALQVAGTVNGQSTFHFLTQAATQGEDDSVKLQAALALANRGDFTDRQFLQQVRTKLRPDLGKSLDALR